jgi:hypothetical protein
MGWSSFFIKVGVDSLCTGTNRIMAAKQIFRLNDLREWSDIRGQPIMLNVLPKMLHGFIIKKYNIKYLHNDELWPCGLVVGFSLRVT